ncbi:hypothetical protein [Pseudoxanthomonas sp.]|uniref:hypothetical protein n=1 Tax=Pseudoxanthomonas sp. TaxID=1871049 RepID=UPI0025842893|nr:hypothetical protein [Pseudoxanthomonas sp.]MCR6687385.1 hypothetical protein [Pseudoxanthomonas sp.]
MDALLEGIEAGKSFKCEERPPKDHEVGVAKVSAVSWGEYDEEESKTCHEKDLVNPDLFVTDGDFLFSRANTIELVGACVIAKRVTKRVMLSDKILRLVLIDADVSNWLLALLRSPFGRTQIRQLSSGNQESMRNIGQERLRQIAVPLPPSSEIVVGTLLLNRGFDSAAALEKAIERSAAQGAAQRKNLLKAAFSGQLVPQDPNDEPASELLARIRDAREQSPAARGRRRAGSNRAPATNSPTPTRRGRKAREGA